MSFNRVVSYKEKQVSGKESMGFVYGYFDYLTRAGVVVVTRCPREDFSM
jgi:hypothetical protein